MPKIKYSNEQVQQLIDGIFNRVINAHHLPKGLYLATANVLLDGVNEGFYDSPDTALLKHFEDNIYMFSGAKTFQQVQHISSLLYKSNLDYKVFKEEALSVYKTYNEAYLESEYVTALTSGTNAKSYVEALDSNGLFTRLKYTAVMDQHTSEICKRLNGIVLPIENPFWRTNTPPNHFNCRCFIEKIDKYDEEPSTHGNKVKSASVYVEEHKQPQFNMNPAINKVIFKKDHPYFSVPKQYKELAKKNFNLPIPSKD